MEEVILTTLLRFLQVHKPTLPCPILYFWFEMFMTFMRSLQFLLDIFSFISFHTKNTWVLVCAAVFFFKELVKFK